MALRTVAEAMNGKALERKNQSHPPQNYVQLQKQ